jgi:hypothetical protein
VGFHPGNIFCVVDLVHREFHLYALWRIQGIRRIRGNDFDSIEFVAAAGSNDEPIVEEGVV